MIQKKKKSWDVNRFLVETKSNGAFDKYGRCPVVECCYKNFASPKIYLSSTNWVLK